MHYFLFYFQNRSGRISTNVSTLVVHITDPIYSDLSIGGGDDLLIISKPELSLVKRDSTLVKMDVTPIQTGFRTGIPIFSAIRTKAATEFAPIFRISWLRC